MKDLSAVAANFIARYPNFALTLESSSVYFPNEHPKVTYQAVIVDFVNPSTGSAMLVKAATPAELLNEIFSVMGESRTRQRLPAENLDSDEPRTSDASGV